MTTIDDDAREIADRTRYLRELAEERRVILRDVGSRIGALRERAVKEITDPARLDGFLAQLDRIDRSLVSEMGR